jgi:hypothetical protein
MDVKQFVKGLFPQAEVVVVKEGLYELRGVPGLSCQAVSENQVWQGAAQELSDPVLEEARKRAAILEKDLNSALKEHLEAIEQYGFAERGYQAWLTTRDSSRDVVLPCEKAKRDTAWEQVCISANQLIIAARRTI